MKNETKPPLKASCATTRAISTSAGIPGSSPSIRLAQGQICNEHMWHDLRWSDLARQVCHLSKKGLCGASGGNLSDICQAGTLHRRGV